MQQVALASDLKGLQGVFASPLQCKDIIHSKSGRRSGQSPLQLVLPCHPVLTADQNTHPCSFEGGLDVGWKVEQRQVPAHEVQGCWPDAELRQACVARLGLWWSASSSSCCCAPKRRGWTGLTGGAGVRWAVGQEAALGKMNKLAGL